MHGAAQRADILEVNDLDVEFHETILIIAAQPHCLQLWRMILPRIRAYFYQWTAKDAASLMKIAQQHQTLLSVLNRRNLRTISSTLKMHILETNPV
jgi:DNA-binding GntR family transcriptional regulator